MDKQLKQKEQRTSFGVRHRARFASVCTDSEEAALGVGRVGVLCGGHEMISRRGSKSRAPPMGHQLFSVSLRNIPELAGVPRKTFLPILLGGCVLFAGREGGAAFPSHVSQHFLPLKFGDKSGGRGYAEGGLGTWRVYEASACMFLRGYQRNANWARRGRYMSRAVGVRLSGVVGTAVVRGQLCCLQRLQLVVELTLAMNALGSVAIWAFPAPSSAHLGLCLPTPGPRTLRGLSS